MTGKEFAKKCQEVMQYNTVYASGTFGQKATNGIIDSKAKQYPKWYTAKRVSMLKALPDDTRMFDCCGLIKGVYWGFPDAVYGSNGLKDVNDQGLYDMSKDKSKDFSKIEIGELLWLKGHVGLYIGQGMAIECTSAWKNKVQITAVANIGKIDNLNSRKWTAHAKLPFLIYDGVSVITPDYSKYPILRRGSRGDSVYILQRLLVAKGYDPKGVDGIFGPGCENAVKNFQKNNSFEGKKLVVDGIVGPKTWGALYN